MFNTVYEKSQVVNLFAKMNNGKIERNKFDILMKELETGAYQISEFLNLKVDKIGKRFYVIVSSK